MFTNATWNAAICDWNANGYRLPTEAEWEYVARGATNTPDYLYSGSDDINDVGWHEGNSARKSHPVAGKAANGLMIYDMSGNVWEWCWDWFGYYSSGHLDNPTGAGSGTHRMRRGGSWGMDAFGSRVSHRVSTVPSTVNYNNGFRVCRAAACAAPRLSPTGGTFSWATNVTIYSETPNTMIYYTTDGSTPTEASTLYEGPIRINSDTTIKARAFRSGWMASPITTASYVLDEEAPDHMVYIPGGTFIMGDTRGGGEINEVPTHSVTLNHFYMSKYEVTQAEYAQYMGAWHGWQSRFGLGDDYPAYWLTWYQAIMYCNLRSVAEGYMPVYSYNSSTNPADWGQMPGYYPGTSLDIVCDWNADGYRLPTEAEWEYAARGGSNTPDYIYSGSDEIDDVAWYRDNSDGTNHYVGEKAPNELGIYDMSGNVREWCWDRYGHYGPDPVTNPPGPHSGLERVIRGGGIYRDSSDCGIHRRDTDRPSGYDSGTGFRVCRSAYLCTVPSFSPIEGSYTASQSISMSTTTPDAQIRYTINGGLPSQSSNLYTGPITVSSTTVIRARTFRDGWTPSPIVEVIYNFETLNPQDMVHVPGGTFIMGDTKGGGNTIELPTHNVTVSSFYMGKYPVSQRHYSVTMGSHPVYDYGNGDTYPAYYVSWYSALKYCNLRSIREGLTPVYTINGSTNPALWGEVPTEDNATWNAVTCNWAASGYRLPTEAEWEYAARSGTNIPDYLYSGSNDINDVAWYSGNNSPYGSKPVGGKVTNELGIYDLSGNVMEWCWDWVGAYNKNDANNPSGPDSGTNRIMRGGNWNLDASTCRVANRSFFNPHLGTYVTGFRVCRADQNCAMPKISHPTGTYAAVQEITITTDTPDAVIYYTTDGSIPNQDSYLYAEPIYIDSTTTIRARAFRTGWTPSLIAREIYTMEEYEPRDMVLIPGGTFIMGDTRGVGDVDETPTHTVTVNSFYMNKYLISNAEYRPLNPRESKSDNRDEPDDRHPPNYTPFYRIFRTCNLLSEIDGLTPVYSVNGNTDPDSWDNSVENIVCDWNANGYRLPTEAEWEYAARGGTNDPDYLYSGSDDIDAVAWYMKWVTPAGIHPVGSKAANALGIYDMSGTMSELCWDKYDEYYYSYSPSNNPTGPQDGSRWVTRGGFNYNTAPKCRVSARDYIDETVVLPRCGIRLCRSYFPEPDAGDLTE